MEKCGKIIYLETDVFRKDKNIEGEYFDKKYDRRKTASANVTICGSTFDRKSVAADI